MCVYCKDAPECDHKRDACAASGGRVLRQVRTPFRGDLVVQAAVWAEADVAGTTEVADSGGIGGSRDGTPSPPPAVSGNPQVPKDKAVR